MLFLCFSTLCSADNYIDAKPAEKVKIRHHHVVLYATSWCGYCKKTRAFLAENNIQYTEYDIETSTHGRDEHRALGGSGVPVMDLKGDVVHGYNTRKMRKIFEALDLM